MMLFITLLALRPHAAHAWNDVGHRLIALIAWELLEPKERIEIVRVLKRHERFQPDFVEQMPVDLPQSDEAKWIFAQASIWSDFIRGFEGDLSERYHRGTWHYINQPIYLTDADRDFFRGRVPANTSFRLSANRPNDNSLNIIQALKLNQAVLKDAAAPDRERALRLCWLFHLVGDLHQPMHSSALFSRVRFPEGDRGGNDILLGRDDNLHRRWDNMLGSNQSLHEVGNRASGLLRSESNRTFGESSQSGNFTDWLAESRRHAEQTAYHQNVFAAVKAAEQTGTAGPVQASLPADYNQQAAPVARRRAIQAGYRLAMLLKQI